jgi:16S rRNA (cytosine1402-N4)-methyltransferase
MLHTAVMSHEVLTYLLHPQTHLVLDATLGGGGHTRAILEASPGVSVIGIDRDEQAIDLACQKLNGYRGRVTFYHGVFTELEAALHSRGRVDGVLVDHGLSSIQLDDPHRGFSYQLDGPLDMRMSGRGQTAEELIGKIGVAELKGILEDFGEISRAGRMARAIKKAADRGSLKTTGDLVKVVEDVFGHTPPPAFLSRLFQSLRIALNRELDLLGEFLGKVLRFVNPDARLVVISYHSLEDRLVKDFFRRASAACICPPVLPVCVCGRKPALEVLTKKAVKTSREEIKGNPRSRSARLRAARVIGQAG